MSIRVLPNARLAPFLKRHMQLATPERELKLDVFLRQTLESAREFVPSEAGVVFLDDPTAKSTRQRQRNRVAAVASFGPGAQKILGQKYLADQGIISQVYVTGVSYYSPDARQDPKFQRARDSLLGAKTRSLLCVPISIRGSVVGVLQLINREGENRFTTKDFELLKVFADYISAFIQNFLDAKRNSEIAKKDSLTGLSNDRHLHNVLKAEAAKSWKAQRELSVLFLDLDHFKQVNDSHGHLAGSRLLFEVAEVISSVLTTTRADIARYGGDEYVVVLPGVSALGAAGIAEKIRRAIEKKVFLVSETADVPALSLRGKITASIGVACLLKHVGANDPNRLLASADAAMYLAKREGRNRVQLSERVLSGKKKSKKQLSFRYLSGTPENH